MANIFTSSRTSPHPRPSGFTLYIDIGWWLKTLYKFSFSDAEQNVILPVKVRKDELAQIHIITSRIGKKPSVCQLLSRFRRFAVVHLLKLHFMQATSSRLPVSKGSWSNNQMVCMKYWVKLGVWAGLCRNLTHFSIHVFVSYLCSNNF